MLKAAYTAIKAVDPSASVIAGVLGAVTTVPGMSLAPQQFLAGMYAAGAQGFFDALSFHPYNYTLPFSAGSGVANSPLEQVKALYALMTANGDGALKVWATEFGNPTSPGGISQTQQAQMLRDFVTAWSKLPFAGPAFVYTANDLNSGYLLDENNFGLFTTSGIPKLAAQTLATLITQLANGTLPNYTAPGMSAPQTIWIQLVSTAIAVVNQVLLIPNIVTGVLYNAAPPILQHAFSAVAHAVSMSAAQTLNAITPAAETGINLLIHFPTNPQAVAAMLGANFYNTERTVQRALASIGIGAAPNADPSTAATAATATAAGPANTGDATAAATATPKPATPAAPTSTKAENNPSTTAPTPTKTPAVPAVSSPPESTAADSTAPHPAETAAATAAATPTKAAASKPAKSTSAPTPSKTTTPDAGATKHAPQNTSDTTKPATATPGSATHPTRKPSATTAKHSESAHD